MQTPEKLKFETQMAVYRVEPKNDPENSKLPGRFVAMIRVEGFKLLIKQDTYTNGRPNSYVAYVLPTMPLDYRGHHLPVEQQPTDHFSHTPFERRFIGPSMARSEDILLGVGEEIESDQAAIQETKLLADYIIREKLTGKNYDRELAKNSQQVSRAVDKFYDWQTANKKKTRTLLAATA